VGGAVRSAPEAVKPSAAVDDEDSAGRPSSAKARAWPTSRDEMIDFQKGSVYVHTYGADRNTW